MPAVHLQRLFINDAADPQTFVALPYLVASKRTPTVPGEVRTNAGGRTRLVRRQGRSTGWAIAPCTVPQATAAAVEALAGRLCCFRDPLGRKQFGVFFACSITDVGPVAGVQSAVVEITVVEVSHSEGVSAGAAPGVGS